MKLICSKANLLKGVNIVSKAVPSKTTMSILECILIDASANEIKFTANDMELGIETIVEGEILEKGIIAIDAKVFSEIVRKLPDNEVTIDSDSNYQISITCEKANFHISGKSGEDFSYLPYIEKTDFISVSQFTLKELIRQTIFSIADNDNNKLMTGELFEVHNNEFKVVSLDGHRIPIRIVKSLFLVNHFRKSARFYLAKPKMKCVFSLPEIISYLNLTIRLLFPGLLRESILRLTRCFPVIMRQNS